MLNSFFDLLIIVGRPASGKSEILAYLKGLTPEVRQRQYHIGPLCVLDDFPLLWAWFEEDDILSDMGHPRLHSDAQGIFFYRYLWNVLIHRLNLAYQKILRDDPGFHDHTTALLEFSRGSEHGGYAEAFNQLSDEVLSRAAVLYVSVSYKESLRKNRRRFNPDRPDSILEHGLPDWKLERLYRQDDWKTLSASDSNFLAIRDFKVPYAVFENEDDVTTDQRAQLAERLQTVLDRLWVREIDLHGHAGDEKTSTAGRL
jgi:hypothetical protein